MFDPAPRSPSINYSLPSTMEFSSKAVRKQCSAGGIGSLYVQLFAVRTAARGGELQDHANREHRREKTTWKHLEATWSALGGHLQDTCRPLGVLGGHLEPTWRPLALWDAPGVQQKSSKSVHKDKIEPERESEHDFEGSCEPTWRPFGSTWRPLGAHLASTWTPGCTWSSAEGFQRRPEGQNRARTRE